MKTLRTGFVVMAALAVLATTGTAWAQHGTYDSRSWSGHVATTSNGECEWLKQILQAGGAYSGLAGWPRMDTTATVDGPNNCGNTGFQAAPGRLLVRQDLHNWDPNYGGRDNNCNQGPSVINNGYWTHAISTGYGWLSGYQPPCGNTSYYEASISSYWNGASWQGNWHYTDWMWIESTFN